MAQSNDARLRIFAPEQGDAGKDRIGNLQVVCVWANLEDILDECFEQAVLVEVHPEGLIVQDMQAAPDTVTKLAADLPALTQAVVTCAKRGVDHEVCSLQRRAAVSGPFQVELDTYLVRITAAQVESSIQAGLVDIHKSDLAASQVGGQAQVADQAE